VNPPPGRALAALLIAGLFATPSVAFAHTEGAAGAGTLAPPVLMITGIAYAIGVRSRWRLSRRRGHLAREAAAFAFGWTALACALLPPLDAAVGRSFAAHMTQHELLSLVAAPLLALGRPHLALACLAPARWRPRVAALMARAVPGLFVAWLLHVIALSAWHVPSLYEAAVRDRGLHAFEHASFLATAFLFWMALLHPRRRRARGGAGTVYLFATGLYSTALGALLTLSPRPWYATHGAGGFSALEDQQVAGLIMWVPGGVIVTVMALLVVARMLRESDAPRTVRRVAGIILLIALAATTVSACDSNTRTARNLTGGDPGHGRNAITKYGCDTCHTIPGVPGAQATIGPPLTGLARRTYVAGAPNDPGRLIEWIRHPQQVRRGTPMPELGVTERDGRDIAAYLYTLR
jgi:cytochrome c oxidase assembly factor CtaG